MYRANLLTDFAKKLEKRLRMAKVQKKGKSKSYDAGEDDPAEGKGHDITKLVAFVSNIEKKQLRSLDVDVKYMKLLEDFSKVTDIVLHGLFIIVFRCSEINDLAFNIFVLRLRLILLRSVSSRLVASQGNVVLNLKPHFDISSTPTLGEDLMKK
jgi:hypothetical protein